MLSAGSLDATFDFDGVVTTAIGSGEDVGRSVVVQADGKIVVAGHSHNGVDQDFSVVRFNADGSLDTSFSGDGTVTTDFGGSTDIGYSVALQSDGKIVVAGSRLVGGDYDFAVARYNVDGSLDTTFDGDGMATSDFSGLGSADEAQSVAIQADGKIVVAGYSVVGGRYEFAVARYTTFGSLDTSFDGDGKLTTNIGATDEYGQEVVVQADGKIVVVGHTKTGSSTDFALVRYNTNGSLDTSFDGDGKLTTSFGPGDDELLGLAIQSDGKIVVGGASSNGGDNDFALARYNSNGSLDTSFGGGDGKVTTNLGSTSEFMWGLAIQADGKIVAAGRTNNGSDTNFALVRYNWNGSLDTTFDGDGIATTDLGSTSDVAYSMALQADGKIVLAGQTHNGSDYDFAVARYDGDPNITVDVNGNLDISTGNSNDHLRLSYDGINDLYLIENLSGGPLTSAIGTGSGTSIVAINPGDFTGDYILFNAGAGDDVLLVDGTLAAAGKVVSFLNDGDGDELEVTSGSFASVIVWFADYGEGGIIDLDGFVVNYSNYLESLDLSGTTAAELEFNSPEGHTDQELYLEDDGITDNAISRIRPDFLDFTATTFSDPTGQLTINLNDDQDGYSLFVNTLPDFSASLTISEPGNGQSHVKIFGDVTLAEDKNLTIDATHIDISSEVVTSGNGVVTLAAIQVIQLGLGIENSISTAGGAVTLTAATIELRAGSSIASDGGHIALTADTMSFDETAVVDAGSATLTLQNRTSGRAINLGSEAGALVLCLTDAELDRIAAGTITIGRNDAMASGQITISAAMQHVGDANISILTGQELRFNAGTSWTTDDGAITLSSPFIVLSSGSSIATADGTVYLDSGGYIIADDGAAIATIGGGIELTGYTIIISGATIGSTTGNILLNGNGVGVELYTGASVGNGTSGTVTVEGTNSESNSDQFAVVVAGGAQITSGGGDVMVVGHAVPNQYTDIAIGVLIDGGGVITAGGTGTVTVIGTSGTFAGINDGIGVYIQGIGSQITSSGGDIFVTAEEGSDPFKAALDVQTGGAVTTAGNGGNITLTADSMRFNATAVIDAGSNMVTLRNRTAGTGIDLGGADAGGMLGLTDAELDRITAGTITIGRNDAMASGQIIVSAAMQHAGDANIDVVSGKNVFFNSGTSWTSINGDLTFGANRQVVSEAGDFHGIEVGNATIGSTTGDITLAGRGGNDGGGNNVGVRILSGAVVGNGTSGIVIVDGIGSPTGFNSYGVLVTGAGSQVISQGGDILITGDGRFGVYVESGGMIRAGVNGSVGIEGTGNSSANGLGVVISGTSSIVTTEGVGGVSILGTGGTSSVGDKYGVLIGGGAQITSGGGDIEVNGQGGGISGSRNYGVLITSGAVVTAGGTGTVSIQGIAGPGSSENVGINIANAQVSSGGGDVHLLGHGGGLGSGADNHGILIGNSEIVAGGSGAVSVQGIGGGTTGNSSHNKGVYISGPNSLITSSGGDVHVVGKGGGSGSGNANVGVLLESLGEISSGGGGYLEVRGEGGNGSGGDHSGILVANGSITSGGGDLLLNGISGNGPSGSAIHLIGSVTNTANGGTITLIGDSLAIIATVAVNAGSNLVTIRNQAIGTDINLGSVDAAGVLGLTDAELDRITAGTIVIGDVTTGQLSVTSAITVTPALELNVATVNLHADVTASGGLSGSASMVNVHPAGVIQDGVDVVNDAGGTVHVASGSYTGNVDASGAVVVLAPGLSPGQVTIIGNLTLDADDNLAIEIDGTNPASEFDNLIVNGEVTLGGAQLNLSGALVPTPGSKFTIIDNDDNSDAVGAAFADLAEGAKIGLNGYPLSVSYVGGDTNDIVLTVGLSGDYNNDDVVDAADYTVWRNTFGTTGLDPYEGADGSGNGEIDEADYGVWKMHYGESLPEDGGGGIVAVRGKAEGGGGIVAVAGVFDPGAGLAEASYNSEVVRGSSDPALRATEGLLDGVMLRNARDLGSGGWLGRAFGRELSRTETGHNRLRGWETGHDNVNVASSDDALLAWLASRDKRRGDETIDADKPMNDSVAEESVEGIASVCDAAFAVIGDV